MLTAPCILAFDAATGPVSVAVWKSGGVAAYIETAKSTMQSAQLMPMIEQALQQAGVRYKQLSAIACTIGPGSFTGIRVGLATARGLVLATGSKGLGFTTLEVLASSARKTNKPSLAVLSAGKGEHYFQGFDANGKALFAPKLGLLETAAALMPPGFVTVGNATLPGVAQTGSAFPRADAMAELAAHATGPAAALNPFYIRVPDATPLVNIPSALL